MRRNSQGGVARSASRGGLRTAVPSSPGCPESFEHTPLEPLEKSSAASINQYGLSATPWAPGTGELLPRRGRVRAAVLDWKRLLDVTIASVALVALSPII